MSGLETSHGEEMHRRAIENGPNVLPLTDPQVQVSLAKIAFRGDAHPMERWLSEGDLANRFRAYEEDATIPADQKHVDIADEHAVAELLEAVKEHPPEAETVH